jgi:hypothetical protein
MESKGLLPVHKGLSLVPILSHMNPLDIRTSYLSFILTLSYDVRQKSMNWSFPFMFPD